MGITELENQLEELEKKEKLLKTELNDTLVIIKEKYPDLGRKWIDIHIKSEIRDKHEHFNGMDEVEVKKMKKEVDELKGKLENSFKEMFINSKDLPHEEIFRKVVSNLGSILFKYGLLRQGDLNSYSTWEKSSNEQFRYGINLGLDHNPEYESILPRSVDKKYIEVYKELDDVSKKIKNYKKQISEAKADDRWNRNN